MDPRFAEPTNPPNNYGYGPSPGQILSDNNAHLQPSYSAEDLNDRSRSPAMSETSQYTSVSQRGVNPRWRQDYGAAVPSPIYAPPQSLRRPRQEDLASNPDFAVAGSSRRRGAPRGGRGGVPPPQGPDSRYPAPL